MKNLLFPHIFQTIGWILFLPALVMGGLLYFNLCGFTGGREIFVNDVVIIGIVIGALFIVCSRERVEDEMTRSIRLASLLNSLYMYAFLLVFCTVLINGIAYLTFMTFNLVLLPVLFVCNFRLEMYRYNKMYEDEEQD